MIQDIEDRFNTQATETVRQMSAFCVWNDRTSNNVRHLAKTYTLDSDLCAVQYELLCNVVKDYDIVQSSTSLVSHTYTHGLHEAYPEIYQLACILLTANPLAVLAVNEPSVNFVS